MRNDAKFIEFWREQFGQADAERIQKLPYLEIDEKLGNEQIFSVLIEEAAEFQSSDKASKTERGKTIDALTVYAMQHLPWEEFTIKLPYMDIGLEKVSIFHAFCHVAKRSKDLKQQRITIALAFKREGIVKISKVMDVEIMLDSGRVMKVDGSKLVHHERQVFRILDTYELYLTYALNYLAMCPERIIETKSTARPSRQQRKAAQKDITERADLPTYILLDPTKAPAYQPPEVRAMVDSAGAKKAPHMRRAHWRRLPGKNVRVRQSWIGPKEWEYQGRSFRVVEAFGNSDADCG